MESIDQLITEGKIHEAADLLIKEKKYDQAIDLLQSTQPKDSKSILKCGNIWEHYKKDLEKAMECYKQASDLGDVDGFFALGFVLLQDDLEKAIEYLEAGAAKGDSKCLLLLATVYSEESENGKFQPEKAVAYCKQSAELGEENALVLLGTFYLEGSFVARSMEEARKCFLPAAEAGNPEAQYQMATNICTATEECIFWLEKAAAQRHPTALYELGMKRLQEGNLDEAVRMLYYSSEEGDCLAQFEMFKIFSEGTLVEPNEHIAYKSCIQAATNGHKQAIFHLGKRLVAMGQAEAGEIWLRKGAEIGKEPKCMILLGEILMKRGETEEATKFLNAAAEQERIQPESDSQMPTKKLKPNTDSR